ncbi:MAG: dethiobiotin synthase [Gammaproteobacteria bacterium]|jgi:dethiobiotin synthetase
MTEVRGFFVTGTDTGIGKTLITLGLMQHLQDRGFTVAGMKPVASGCETTAQGLRNDDAVQLQRQASCRLSYAQVNPVALAAPVAPHIAARQDSAGISVASIRRVFDDVAKQADRVVVEGVGGWRVPLGERETLADLARALGLPVVLVVGMRLGCLNHALLTAEAIAHDGLHLAGWVANCLPPAPEALEENIIALETRLSAPLLGVVPALSGQDAQDIARRLTLQV